MTRTHRTFAVVGACVVLAAATRLANAQSDTDAVDRAFAALSQRLAAGGTTVEHEAWLRAFLTEHAARPSASVLRARVLLGNLLLHRIALAEAIAQYEEVIVGATAIPDETLRELQARALYGVVQAAVVLDDRTRAEVMIHRILRDHAGSRFARLAEAELQRLRVSDAPKAGEKAPKFDPRQDLTGRSRDLSRLRGRPAFIVFWSPDSPASSRTLTALRDAWVDAGQSLEQWIVFAIARDEAALRKAVADLRIEAPVVHCQRDVLDPSILDWHVSALPQSFLLGSDLTIVARDLPIADLRRVLRAYGTPR